MSGPSLHERTPLLAESSPRLESDGGQATSQHPPFKLPVIQPTVARLQRDGLPPGDDWAPMELMAAQKTAFMLIVLARFRATSNQLGLSAISGDIWERWYQELGISQAFIESEKRALHLWSTFLSQQKTLAEISVLFWQQYPLDETESTFVRGTLSDFRHKLYGSQYLTFQSWTITTIFRRDCYSTPCIP